MNTVLLAHINEHQHELIEQIKHALSEHIFENRYTVHPRRIQDAAGEELLQFKEYIETCNIQAVNSLAQKRVVEGFGLPSVLATGKILRKFFFKVIDPAQTEQLESALTLVGEYMDAYLVGYVKAMETSILVEQERTHQAYLKALEQQSPGL